MEISRENRGILAMLTLSLIYGVAGFTARTLQTYFGTWQQLALQSWAACLLCWLIVKIFPDGREPRKLTLKDLKSLFGRALIGRVVSSYFFIKACLYAPLGNVGWISALPTSALFAWWLFGQCVSTREWLLLSIGMVGVGFIVAPEIDIINILGEGELYALISTFAGGLGMLLGRNLVRERGAIYPTSWVLFFSAMTATIAAIIFEGGLKIPPLASLPMLTLVTLMVALGSACSLYGFTHLRASTATAVLSLEAVWAVILGILIYGEYPSAFSLLGGSIIVIVAYLIAPQKGLPLTYERTKNRPPGENWPRTLESCRN